MSVKHGTNRFYPRSQPPGGGSGDCGCTTSTPGPCDAELTLPPAGSDLPFKGLDAGAGITITDTGTCVEIAATGTSSTSLVLSGIYNCPVTVGVGDAVSLAGPDSVAEADAGPGIARPAVGIVQSKPSPVLCILAYMGELPGFAGLSPGSTYFLSASVPGQITATAPSGSGILVQTLGFARSATVLVVMMDRDGTLLR